MKRQFWKSLGASATLAALPALAVIGQSPRVASADENGGRVVQISPENDAESVAVADEKDAAAGEAKQPAYWIGLGGAPLDSPALRTQLQLADDVGVLVANIVPGSPAEKAGLRLHDVVVALNGEPISDLKAVQKAIADGGKKPLELKIIRLAKESTVKVTPEERPKDAPQALPGGQGGGNFGGLDLNQLLPQNGMPRGMRMFGNGMVLGGQPFNLNQMPGGVSVSMSREGDGPATVTVKKGDKTWTVKGDDEKALKELPDDVRPFVQNMLHGGQGGMGGMHFNLGDLQSMLSGELGDLNMQGIDHEAVQKRLQGARERTQKAGQQLQERLEQMEKQIHQLQEQLEEHAPAERTNHDEDASKT